MKCGKHYYPYKATRWLCVCWQRCRRTHGFQSVHPVSSHFRAQETCINFILKASKISSYIRITQACGMGNWLKGCKRHQDIDACPQLLKTTSSLEKKHLTPGSRGSTSGVMFTNTTVSQPCSHWNEAAKNLQKKNLSAPNIVIYGFFFKVVVRFFAGRI